MRKAVHHLRRPVAIKRTSWFPSLSPPAVFDGTPDSEPPGVRTKQKTPRKFGLPNFRQANNYANVP
jgi:hypothetical protein